MADKKQSPTEKAAPDPTVVGKRGDVPEYPEGTHPIVPIEDQTWGPNRVSYGDLDDDLKPDPTSIVQTVEEDPIVEDNQKALGRDAEYGRKQQAKGQESK